MFRADGEYCVLAGVVGGWATCGILQVVSKSTKLDDEEGGEAAAAPEYVAEKGGGTVWLASTVIFLCGLTGMAFAGFLFWTVSQISLDSSSVWAALALAALMCAFRARECLCLVWWTTFLMNRNDDWDRRARVRRW